MRDWELRKRLDDIRKVLHSGNFDTGQRHAVIRMGWELHDAVLDLHITGNHVETPAGEAVNVLGQRISRAKSFEPRAFQVVELDTFLKLKRQESAP